MHPTAGGANQFFGSTLTLAGSTLMVGAPEKAMLLETAKLTGVDPARYLREAVLAHARGEILPVLTA